MKVEVPKGKYVVAVSGGVDSMVLLDLLSNLPSVELVVAHFNHGIRPDSAADEKLVVSAAKKYRVPAEIGYGKLGAGTSEAAARTARYDFFRSVRDKHGANAIITAHHQDDLLETAVINLVRGTGRKGLSAITANPEVIRPLLNFTKKELQRYARQHKIAWREDPSNADEAYLRNYIRRQVIPKMDSKQRQALLDTIQTVAAQNLKIDKQVTILADQLKSGKKIDRRLFTTLPAGVANEVMAYWLRQDAPGQLDRKTIERLSLAAKTAKPGTHHHVSGSLMMAVTQNAVYFKNQEG